MDSGDGAGEPEVSLCPLDREQQRRTWGEATTFRDKKDILARLPQVRASASLPRGVRADLRAADLRLQDCEQWRKKGTRGPLSPGWLVPEGKERTSPWKSTPGKLADLLSHP